MTETPALPPGTRRITEQEERWLAEAHRWTEVSTVSAFATESPLKAICLPGRIMWISQAEWEGLRDAIKGGWEP